jgi:hypothetical protein
MPPIMPHPSLHFHPSLNSSVFPGELVQVEGTSLVSSVIGWLLSSLPPASTLVQIAATAAFFTAVLHPTT